MGTWKKKCSLILFLMINERKWLKQKYKRKRRKIIIYICVKYWTYIRWEKRDTRDKKFLRQEWGSGKTKEIHRHVHTCILIHLRKYILTSLNVEKKEKKKKTNK